MSSYNLFIPYDCFEFIPSELVPQKIRNFTKSEIKKFVKT
jgi:hypothetical protein